MISCVSDVGQKQCGSGVQFYGAVDSSEVNLCNIIG